ncbi:hypothetical protein [Halosimplex pelagicum]|uniref:DUF7964 domain-containing protein n=1 Tax=Halosimplex pelagicum TaxID=869886 RepID=A0A7D5P718_9EURY|nr:hypothetical protein [Halosimplex pelagicum]QLH82366.1 hypothetical protein HZS54_12390 [Halosimplex pelagicum]
MIPCIPEHVGENPCPSCGTNHEEFPALPNRPLSIADCSELVQGNEIDGIMPIFRIHTKENYQKAVPAIVMVVGTTVRILWLNPKADNDWVIVREETEVDFPFELGKEMGEQLRDSTYKEDTIEGYEVVYPDNELLQAVESN